MLFPKPLQKNESLPKSAEHYRMIRQRTQKLGDNILTHFSNLASPLHVAKELGMMQGNRIALHDKVQDVETLMNYLLYYYQIKGKTILELYKAEMGGTLEELDQQILDAQIASKIGFYKIIACQPKDCTLTLRPLERQGEPDVVITNIGLSRSAITGLLVYTRIITLDDFAMTSGVTLTFMEKHETYILRNYRSAASKFRASSKAGQEFLGVYKLFKTHGSIVRLQDILPT